MGGASRRFGQDKALVKVGDTTMGAMVVDALRRGGVDPVVAVGGQASAALAIPTVADRWSGQGPLAGVASVLLWAKRATVLIVHCDLPRLDPADVATLVAAIKANPGKPIVAATDQTRHTQILAMPAAMGPEVRDLVRDGNRRLRSVFDLRQWIEVQVAPISVQDADTPQALRSLLADRQ